MTDTEEENQNNDIENESNENAFDMLNIRDFCGTSRNVIQDYFYYNYYNQETFNYKLTYKENPLLDIIDGKGKILDYILTLIPFVILLIFGFVYIFCCTAFWICICCPIDCCKKNKTICNKKILLILFHIFSIIILIFGILGIIFINFSKQDLHGMVCSLNLFIYNIIYGQGVIKKSEFKKPMWQSLETLKNIAIEGQTLFTDTIDKCSDFKIKYPIAEPPRTTNQKCIDFGRRSSGLSSSEINVELLSNSKYCSSIYESDVMGNFQDSLSTIYSDYKDTKLNYKNISDDTKTIEIKPLYIDKLGHNEDQNTNTFLGKINNEFNNNYMNSFDKFFGIVYKNCMIMRDELSDYTDALSNVGDFTDDLKDSLNDISEKVVNKLSNYIKDYENYLFSTYIAFLVLIIIFVFLLNIVFFLYLKSYYNISRKFIIIFWVIINIVIIILFILSSLLGIFSYVFNDVGDVLDFIFSPENLKSEEPRLLPGSGMDKIVTCLNPKGNLFDTFIDSNEFIIIAVNVFNELYNLKYLIMNESYLYSDSIQTSKNQLNSIPNINKILDEYKNDFSLTTNSNSVVNIQDEIDELNLYSYSAKYQEQCSVFSPIYWTSKDCPTSTEGQCKLISTFSENYYSSANTCNFKENSGYNSAHPSVSSIENNYLKNLQSYYNQNKGKIDEIELKFNSLSSTYKSPIVTNMHQALEDSLAIVDLVFNVFKNYIDNDPIENPENFENPKVDIFSFLNCSSIGRDLNVTIFIIKEKLSKDFLSVSIMNYIMNFISIFVIILVVFLLNLYKLDENEEINKENEKKDLINNEGTPNSENNENNEKYIKTTSISNEKLNLNEKEKSNSDLNNKTDDEDKKNNDFLMNKKDNNDIINSISKPNNIEINNKNDDLEKISEEEKNNNEYKYEDVSDF